MKNIAEFPKTELKNIQYSHSYFNFCFLIDICYIKNKKDELIE